MERGYIGPDCERLPDVREPGRAEEPEGSVVAPLVPTKRCTKCGLVKEATTDNFHRHKRNKTGLSGPCADCGRKIARNIAAGHRAGARPKVVRAHKECYQCKRVLALNKDNFYVSAGAPDGFHAECRMCASDRFVLRTHGITPAEYAALLDAQAGVCSICKKPQPGTKIKRLHVDHDHSSGLVRGLLCVHCNRVLSYVESTDFTPFHAYLASPPAVAVLGVKKVPTK